MTAEASKSQQRSFPVKELLIAGNHGPCGGVNMAYETAKEVLDIVDGRETVYTNWDFVNNRPLVAKLAKRNLISVQNNWDLAPRGSIMLFSAHGAPPEFHQIAAQRDYLVVDLTCQLVTRVHNLVLRAERDGYHILYIGVKGHPETIGVMGELQPENVSLVEKVEDISDLDLKTQRPKIVYSQTTRSTREIADIMRHLKQTDPSITIPNRGDICYAADNRQLAVEELVKKVSALVVVGSRHSHNSQELRAMAESSGLFARSVDTAEEMDPNWFTPEMERVGLTSGASVMNEYLQPVVQWFQDQNPEIKISQEAQVRPEEEMTFALPKKDLAALKQRYQSW